MLKGYFKTVRFPKVQYAIVLKVYYFSISDSYYV